MSTKRKQVYLAVAGSVGIHLAVLFAWAFAVQWFPVAQASQVLPPEPLKVEVVEEKPEVTPTPEPNPLLPTPTPKLAFKDTGEAPDDTQPPPKDARFQAARNSEAASERAAAGEEPNPTQKGRPVPQFAFDTHPYTPGDEGSAAGQNVPENMPPVAPLTAPPPPRAVTQSTPPPKPAATPESTPADPRDLAMVAPASIPANPADIEPNPYDPSFRAPAGMTEPPRPTPVPRRGGYQAQQERTNAVGSITKFGASSLSTQATPSARYVSDVTRAVNYRYHQLVDARADMISLGTVKVQFLVDRDGKVRASRVVANSANEALAGVTLRALAEAHIAPMPAEVTANFDGGIMPMMIIFDLN